MAEPASTPTSPAGGAALGIPGLFDVHVHFLPPPIMRKVREQFDSAGPLIGRPWPLAYRGDDDERVDRLRALGVRHFSSLPYAHRPGIAAYLNELVRASSPPPSPSACRSATFYPEHGVAAYVAELVAAGTRCSRCTSRSATSTSLDPLLDDAWGTLAEAGTPVVIHAGGGPVGNAHTGPGPMREADGAAPDADRA